jgi:signal transduction histidine kinase
VTSLGELTASIAHEVNQPLGAVVANAEACLGWLDRESPDLNEAHAAIERIVRDGHRAGEVIRRVRALIKRTDTQMVPLDANERSRCERNTARSDFTCCVDSGRGTRITERTASRRRIGRCQLARPIAGRCRSDTRSVAKSADFSIGFNHRYWSVRIAN